MTPFVKNGLTLIGLIVVAGLGYYLFVLKAESELSSSAIATNASALASEQFLRELNKIKRLDLSGDVFADIRFTSLQDFSEPVRPVNVGQTNPFRKKGE